MSPEVHERQEPNAESKELHPIQVSECAWGIELGTHSLKVLRLGCDFKQNRIAALSFDIVKLEGVQTKRNGGMGQMGTALARVLERHEIGDDRVAMVVSDPTALLNFCEIPATDVKKLHDLVTYEARIQIPIPLENVVWDYQNFSHEDVKQNVVGGMDLLCLAALRYDRFDAALTPFDEVGVAVDIVQLAPAALFNYAKYDEIAGAGDDEPLMMLDMNTKATTTTIIDGSKIWRRTFGMGGDDFTKALAKLHGLSPASAELMKRNLAKSPNPGEVLESLRPVFEAYSAEVLRTMRQFSSTERNVRLVAMGSGFQLPALAKYIQKKVGYPVERLERFRRIDCSLIEGQPLFRESLSSLAGCCGLALQALGKGRLTLNLIPDAIRPKRSRTASRSFSWFGRGKSRN